jgi:hypothetical protein
MVNSPAISWFGIPTPVAHNTETWNGTSWTEVTELNTAEANGQWLELNTASYYIVEETSSKNTSSNEIGTELAWTEVDDLNSARSTQQV